MKTSSYWRRTIAACSTLILGFGLSVSAKPPYPVGIDAEHDPSPPSQGSLALLPCPGPGFCGNYSTGFEPGEGFTLGKIAPPNGLGQPVLEPDDSLRWSTSGGNLSLLYGEVNNVNPEGASTQHLRIDYDPARPTGRPVLDLRTDARIPKSAVAGGLGVAITPILIDMDVAITADPGVGSTHQIQPQHIAAGLRTLKVFFDRTDPFQVYKIFVQDPGFVPACAGSYCDTGVVYPSDGTYRHLKIDFNPCFNIVSYYYEDAAGSLNLIFTGTASMGQGIDQFLTFSENNLGSMIDIDNLVIERVPLSPAACGDGLIDACAGEECDAGGIGGAPLSDANCPGRCLADCTCRRDNVDCATARDVGNGDSGPYLTDGGWFKYTADTPFVTIEGCDSDYDTMIFWDVDPESCDPWSAAALNDECANVTWGGFQQRGTPAAPCYVGGTFGDVTGGFNGLSCLCMPTVPGTTYTFAVLGYGSPPILPPVGGTTAFNINKKLDCTEAGVCANSCNGTCGAGTCTGTCTGICGLGICDNAPTPDVCQGLCVMGRVGEPCKGDRMCDIPLIPAPAGACNLTTFMCDAGNMGPCPGGLDSECDIPGTQGICMGVCQASQAVCEGDIQCPPIPPTNLCTSGPLIGQGCATDPDCYQCTAGAVGLACPSGLNADCNLCTAGAVGQVCTTDNDCKICAVGSSGHVGEACLIDNDCKKCTAGEVGIDCDTNADCLMCTRGPNIGTDCTTNTQCGGAACRVGDVNAICVTNADCTLEGEKVPGGACCDGWTGRCTDAVANAAACDALSLSSLPAHPGPAQGTWHEQKLCNEFLDPPCIRHTGACCDGSPKAVHCTNGTYPEDCDGANQTWWKGATCEEVPYVCPALTLGACCNTLAGTCTNNETVTSCGDTGLPGDQRVFSVDKTCGNLDPPCSAVSGACCDKDPFGGCTETTNANCQGGKLEWTKLKTCAQIDCLHDAIPTVSEWGLVVLTLLLLIGAKVYFGRRQAAAA